MNEMIETELDKVFNYILKAPVDYTVSVSQIWTSFFFTSQHTIGYQSFEASSKMTRHQQSSTWHGFDTTSI